MMSPKQSIADFVLLTSVLLCSVWTATSQIEHVVPQLHLVYYRIIGPMYFCGCVVCEMIYTHWKCSSAVLGRRSPMSTYTSIAKDVVLPHTQTHVMTCSTALTIPLPPDTRPLRQLLNHLTTTDYTEPSPQQQQSTARNAPQIRVMLKSGDRI